MASEIVKARIRQPADGGLAFIEVQRAKFKHWFLFGKHAESDKCFRAALYEGAVVWSKKIIEPRTIFP